MVDDQRPLLAAELLDHLSDALLRLRNQGHRAEFAGRIVPVGQCPL